MLDKTTTLIDAALPGSIARTLKEVIMNTQQVFAAITLALVGASSFAFESDAASQAASTLSRAEVKAELAAAIANHTMPVAHESSLAPQTSTAATGGLSRQDVRAETRAYVRSGQAARDHQSLSAIGG